MKKTLSICLLAIVSCSTCFPIFAQKSTNTGFSLNNLRRPATRFASAQAVTDGNGVFLEWIMEREIDNVGFYVYRSDYRGRELVSEFIGGSSLRVGAYPMNGEKYTFFDAEGDVSSNYTIESLHMSGKKTAKDALMPKFVENLTELAGSTSQEMADFSKSKPTVTSNALHLTSEVSREVSRNLIASDIDTHNWVVAQPGVRIGVRKEGMYRVTKSALETGGFNVNSDPNFWQLYVEGVEQALIVGPNSEYIEFYGKGVDTVESDTGMYYLVSGTTAGKRIQSRGVRPAAGTVIAPNYEQSFIKKERTTYSNDILNGSAGNYWGRGVGSLTATVPFTLTAVDFQRSEAALEVKFQGFSFGPHSIQVVLNGQTLSPTNANGRAPFSGNYVVPTSFLLEGSNNLQLTAMGPTGDFSLFDSVSVNFGRKHIADQNQLAFYTQNYRTAKLEGFSSQNIRVFDITAQGSPVLLTNLSVQQDGSSFGTTIPASRGRLMYAIENSALLQPASITTNNPSVLRAPANEGDLIIITYRNWMAEAENWANYRRGQGFAVKVVEVSDIYDEFNYGVLSADSIESFLFYAKNNWVNPPEYVLLLGDSTYDSRNYEGLGFFNFVPTRIVNTLYSETGSDESLADFNNDGLAEIAIGRVPVRSGQSATNILAKVTSYEQSLPATPLDRGALFAYDSFDATNNYDFQQISTRIRNQLPASMPVKMIGRGETPPPPDTPQTLLINTMNSGKYIINYSGHGTIGSWAAASFFFSGNVSQLTNANSLSIYTMLTCLNGYFLTVTSRSLSETLLESTTGGGIAVWASSGLTTPDIQEVMATRFYRQISSGSLTRMGDLVKDAKSTLPGGSDVRLSWVLIGDPMLKVREASTGGR